MNKRLDFLLSTIGSGGVFGAFIGGPIIYLARLKLPGVFTCLKFYYRG